MSNQKKDPIEKIVEPIEVGLVELIKEYLKCSKSIQGKTIESTIKKLAKATGRSPRSIQSVLYEGSGSLRFKLAIILECYNFNRKSKEHLMEKLKTLFKKESSVKESDQKWLKFGSSLTDEEKLYWTEAIDVLRKLGFINKNFKK